MHITPHMIEQTYELLKVTLPFRRWILPHSDDLGFRVTLHRDRHAHYRNKDGAREIVISQVFAKDLDKLTRDVAHEMVHLHLDETGRARVNHGPKFQRLANTVCLRHGWDVETF